MKPRQSTGGWQQLVNEVELARIRLANAKSKFTAKRKQSLLAKRQRREAKEAARSAKKQARQAKKEVNEAELILTEAEARLSLARKSTIRSKTKPAATAAKPTLKASRKKVGVRIMPHKGKPANRAASESRIGSAQMPSAARQVDKTLLVMPRDSAHEDTPPPIVPEQDISPMDSPIASQPDSGSDQPPPTEPNGDRFS